MQYDDDEDDANDDVDVGHDNVNDYMDVNHHCIVDDWATMAETSLHLSLLLPAPLPLPWPAVAAGEGQSDLAARPGIHSTRSMSWRATTMRTAGRNYKVVLSCVSKVILITLHESKAIYI